MRGPSSNFRLRSLSRFARYFSSVPVLKTKVDGNKRIDVLAPFVTLLSPPDPMALRHTEIPI